MPWLAAIVWAKRPSGRSDAINQLVMPKLAATDIRELASEPAAGPLLCAASTRNRTGGSRPNRSSRSGAMSPVKGEVSTPVC
jgi:hypothetical protein